MARTSNKADNLPILARAVLKVGKENGFATMPVSKIAREANLSPGTLYLYFKDKDEMMLWIFSYIREQIETYFFRNYKAETDLAEKFSLLSLNLIDFYVTNPLEHAFIDFFVAQNFGSTLSVFSKKMETEFAAMYKTGVEEKRIKKLPFFATLSLIHGPILALSRNINLGNLKDDKKLRNDFVAAVWDSISV